MKLIALKQIEKLRLEMQKIASDKELTDPRGDEVLCNFMQDPFWKAIILTLWRFVVQVLSSAQYVALFYGVGRCVLRKRRAVKLFFSLYLLPGFRYSMIIESRA